MRKVYQNIWRAVATASVCVSSFAAAQAGEWMVGAGMYDVTGPAADRGMVGYGDTGQTTQGIHTRLWSRAFTMGKTGTSDYVVFVSADLQSITQGVRQGVMKKIAADSTLSLYLNEANVMLTATHTHVGPGGYDHTAMLNMSALGYDGDNYNTVVDGIYQSIKESFNNKAEGKIKFKQGKLTGTNINRAPEMYAENDDADNYNADTNEWMTLIKLVKDNGDEVGMINWYGMHNVSASQDYRYVSADNKGVASQMFEADKGTQAPLSTGFVAAFANSEEGDVSPNTCGIEDSCGSTTEEGVYLVAKKQYDKAKSLYDSATNNVTGTLAARIQYVDMPGYQVNGAYTYDGSDTTICEGSIGWSFTAGQYWDGPSNIDGIFEGMTQDNEGSEWNQDSSLIGNVFAGYPMLGIMNALSDLTVGGDNGANDACQYPKPTFLNTQMVDGVSLYTDVLPFQSFQIGRLVLIGVPGEMTTMSARRLRADIKGIMKPHGEVKNVIIAGLANAYSGYITTPEEYKIQHYAGGHTLWGPETLAAHRQVFANQATSIIAGTSLSQGATAEDLVDDQIINAIGVVYDDKRLWEEFGETTSDTASTYFAGQTATATFRSGHPQNDFQTMDSFFKVQQNVGGNWETVLTENDVEAHFQWIRDTDADCLACSYAKVSWTIADDMASGTYRLKHDGDWKSGWDGSINAYSGTSSSFTVDTSASIVEDVSLLGAHGRYLRAESGGGADVRNDRTSIGNHETFTMLDLDNDDCIQSGDSVAFLTDANNYFRGTNITTTTEWSWDSWSNVTVESGGELDANASSVGSWEKFTLTNHTDGSGCLANNDQISLKSTHNRYVAAESNEDVNANRTSAGSWEKFTAKVQ